MPKPKKKLVRIHYVMREKGDPSVPGIYVAMRCYMDELTGLAYCDPEGLVRVRDLDIEVYPMDDVEEVYLRDDGTKWEGPKLAEGESEKPKDGSRVVRHSVSVLAQSGIGKSAVVPLHIVK